jgi:hypothetical protein
MRRALEQKAPRKGGCAGRKHALLDSDRAREIETLLARSLFLKPLRFGPIADASRALFRKKPGLLVRRAHWGLLCSLGIASEAGCPLHLGEHETVPPPFPPIPRSGGGTMRSTPPSQGRAL